MEQIFLTVLTIIFIVESFFEIRYFTQIRNTFVNSGRATPTKRVQRIIKIENMWSWVSWIFLFLLFILPDLYTMLVICVITLIETWVVYELYNARDYVQRINK
ncbi:hypothetical protein QUW44_08140 [Limosilactobacillus pontis]|jgi:hypothetical protein|uniref:Uncharacterized protein n=1 Tax=Limosilactobacillus pontis TaxID=35787 RepID=A0ABT7V000_9LACO|nr:MULTISPECIES: hypothetical protein [Limosilactobacillus]MDM8267112.1 hypothetical protein [Limosilactobacillus pontis]MDM8332620.1 hypothetical protein [Limosilactobacillus pontis]